ncbi:hypothetical protein GGF43_006410, partial [Coemansia sp. RSA 2618]
MPFSTLPARGRYARWGEHGSQQRMSGEGEKPYAMEANPDRRRQPYTRADNARYENSRPADDTPRLAPGWRTAYTGDGIPYYYHEATKETRWEPPVADQPPKGGNRYADLGVNSPGARDGHFSRRKADGRDARVYSAASSFSAAGAEKWTSSSGSRLDRSYTAAAAGEPKTHVMSKTKVDEIVDRAMRLGVHTPGQNTDGRPGSTQLVTPETD